jgi:four helix bundle protein
MSQTTRGYKDLMVWQKAMALVPVIYRLVQKLPKQETYALSDQIRRAVISIPANIAEGQARQHKREFVQYLSIARGSLAELDTLLLAAQQLEYFTQSDLKSLSDLIIEVRRMLQGLIRSLQA